MCTREKELEFGDSYWVLPVGEEGSSVACGYLILDTIPPSW